MADNHQNKPVTGYPAAQSSYPTPNTATAYPYPAPPPPPQPGAYYHPNPYPLPPPPYDPRRALFLRRLVAAVIAVLVIIGAVTFIIWLVLRPHLPRFSVVSANLSNFNLSSSSHLTADWNISISARNPNSKMGIYYDRVEASIFYGREILSSTSLDPFYQGKHNVTTIEAELASVSEYVDGDISRGLKDDQSNQGFVKFDVKLMAWVRFRAGAWRTRRHVMRVFCDDVRMGFSSSNRTATLLGGSSDCEVDL